MEEGIMEHREMQALPFIVTFIITTFLFVMIFSVANFTSYLNYSGISSENSAMSVALSDLNVYIESSSCEHTYLLDSSKKLDEVGAKLNILEKSFGKLDSRVVEQKVLYSEIEMRHYALIKKLNDFCGKNFTTLLFFYSNSEEKQDESDNMGYILGVFKQRHPDEVMVYSFDSNLNSTLIDSLLIKYNISYAPVVLINDNQGVEISNLVQLEKIVFEKPSSQI